MQILVCVKQVPAPENRFLPQDAAPGYTEAGLSFRMNLYDEYALEEALRLKDKVPGCSVTAVSVGPERVRSAVLRALEMGADHGVHILDESSALRDAYGIAHEIAAWAAGRPFDLILTGVMAEDDQRCQTGPFLACSLGIPYATSVLSFEVDPVSARAVAERERENGYSETVALPLPALLAIQSGTRQPRYPSLSNKLRARRQPIEVVRANSGQRVPRLLECAGVGLPKACGSAVYLSGSPQEAAGRLLEVLEKKQLL
ncbi:MAG: electron transfer flavoprotein subunit beta/FixA family protein [bacterium]